METPYTDLKKFIKALFWIMLGIVLADTAIGSGLGYLYKRQRSGLLYRSTYAIDSTRADYIVLGSSRANHDYDPKVFEAVLKTSFYNCGRDKQGLLYSCAVLSAILQRYHPKGVIIDIRPDEFTQSDAGTLATLLPYHHNAAIRPYLDYNSRSEQIKLFSHIYPYNSLLTNLVVGLRKDWKEDYKGYRPLNEHNRDTSWLPLNETAKPDSDKIIAIGRVMGKLQQLNIPVLLVISPVHYRYTGSITVNICKKLADQFPVSKFINYANDKAYTDNQNYSDNNHLNVSGAALFSRELSTAMKNGFQNRSGGL